MAEPGEGGDGGGQTITPEQFEALQSEIQSLKANRDEILSEKKKLGERLKALDGIDPEEHKSLKQKMADLETQAKAKKEGISSEQLEKLRKEVRDSLETEFSPFKQQAEQLAKENRALKLDNVVKVAMGKAGARSDRIDSLYKLTSDRFDLTDDGKPMVRESPGVEVDKYIGDVILKEYAEWFSGTGSSGGGASKSSGGTGGGNRVVSWSDTQAISNDLEGVASGKTVVRPQ